MLRLVGRRNLKVELSRTYLKNKVRIQGKAKNDEKAESRYRDCVIIRHPGQVPQSGTRAGIQKFL